MRRCQIDCPRRRRRSTRLALEQRPRRRPGLVRVRAAPHRGGSQTRTGRRRATPTQTSRRHTCQTWVGRRVATPRGAAAANEKKRPSSRDRVASSNTRSRSRPGPDPAAGLATDGDPSRAAAAAHGPQPLTVPNRGIARASSCTHRGTENDASTGAACESELEESGIARNDERWRTKWTKKRKESSNESKEASKPMAKGSKQANGFVFARFWALALFIIPTRTHTSPIHKKIRDAEEAI